MSRAAARPARTVGHHYAITGAKGQSMRQLSQAQRNVIKA